MEEEPALESRRSAGRPRLSAAAHAAFQEKIADIAREQFFEQGFNSVSMRKIAERAGCSTMSLYHYFPSKHAILRHIWISIFDRIDASLANLSAASDDPLDQLKSMIQAYVHFWIDNPAYFHIVYLTTDPQSIALGDTVLNTTGSSVKRVYERFDHVLSACVLEGQLAGAAPEVMAQILFSSIYGMLLCTLTIPEYRWLAPDRLSEELIRHFIRGYTPQRGAV